MKSSSDRADASGATSREVDAPVPRSGEHRASGDLGQQAAIAADRARQHRRRDVDHRRRVARPGPERERQGRDPVASSAPTRSRCSARGAGADRRGEAARSRAIRASRSTTPRRFAAFSPRIRLVMAEAGDGGQVKYRSESLDSVGIRGVTKEYISPADDATSRSAGRSRRREFDDGRQVDHSRLGHGRPAVRHDRSDRQDRHARRRPLPRRRRGGEEGRDLRPVAGRVRDRAARCVSADLRHAAVARSSRCVPTDPSAREGGHGRCDAWPCGFSGGCGRASPTTSASSRRTRSSTIYNQATSAIFAVLLGVVSLSLVVGGIVIMNIMLMVVSERTREIGAAQVARRATARHPVADSDRVGHAVDFRRACAARRSASSWPGSSARSVPLPAIVETWSVVLGISMTAVVGLFFGLYPAMRAARARSDRSAAAGVSNALGTLQRNPVDVVGHDSRQQDAIGPDGARRRHRHHVDRRHHVAAPRLRRVAHATSSGRSARTRSSWRSSRP